MPRRLVSLLTAILALPAALVAPVGSSRVRAEDARTPPTAAIGGSLSSELHRVAPRESSRKHESSGRYSASTGGWWLGTAGIALLLAAFGGISLASRRFLPRRDAGPLQVVGRVALSSKQAVCLLRAGERILIIGTGTTGSPTLLGELPSSGAAPVPTSRQVGAGA
jgi:hypothetical protein